MIEKKLWGFKKREPNSIFSLSFYMSAHHCNFISLSDTTPFGHDQIVQHMMKEKLDIVLLEKNEHIFWKFLLK